MGRKKRNVYFRKVTARKSNLNNNNESNLNNNKYLNKLSFVTINKFLKCIAQNNWGST